MGFRYRKSKNFGPFRINLSKSGVGWSVGGKGFRYTKRQMVVLERLLLFQDQVCHG